MNEQLQKLLIVSLTRLKKWKVGHCVSAGRVQRNDEVISQI